MTMYMPASSCAVMSMDSTRLVQRRAQPGWRSLLRHFRWASHGVRRARGSLLGSNQWFVVAGAGKGDHSKRRKPAWRSRRLVCQSSRQYRNPLFRPGRCRVSGVAAPFARGCGADRGAAFAFLIAEQSDSVLLPTVTCLNHSIPAPGTP